jgi:hypothetical protein
VLLVTESACAASGAWEAPHLQTSTHSAVRTSISQFLVGIAVVRVARNVVMKMVRLSIVRFGSVEGVGSLTGFDVVDMYVILTDPRPWTSPLIT